ELLGADARVLRGDARQPAAALRRDFPSGVRGFVVSNELPDAFGVHKLILSAKGDVEVVLVVPRIEAALAGKLPAALATSCRETDAQLRSAFRWELHPGAWLLDRHSFGAVMTCIYARSQAETGPLLNQVWFDEVRVPACYFEPLLELLRAGAEPYARALGRENSGVVQYVNVHARRYVRDLAQVLAAGQIMTIDYGDTTAGLVQGARRGKFPFRVYCDEGDYHPRANHPYTWPGSQDLTADVNFTDLALAGLGAGLELVYYGPERALAGAELPRVIASADQKPFAKFVGNSVFKLLVLGRDAAWCPKGKGLEAWPVLSDDAGLEAAEQPLASIVERLTSSSDL
ncbi:MAG TPA: SAM-dependent methyltransferase, partial [Polyangiaceae bacterium]